MASEEDEIAALDRVLTRTVLTKDEDLQQLLTKLLPALIQKLSTTQPKVRAKVLELLTHINKRVKALPSTQLPLIPLVTLALDGSAGPMVRSFALVYVEMGQPRATPQQQLEAIPLLLQGLAGRPPQHRAVALRVVTAAMALLKQAPAGSYSEVVAAAPAAAAAGSSSSTASTPVNAPSLLPAGPADRQLLLDHALKVLLYQRPSSGNRAPTTPLGLATAAAGGGAAAAPAGPPPPGLSAADVAALEEKGVPSQDSLIQLKLGLLCLLGAAAAGAPGNAAAAAKTAGSAAAAAASEQGAAAAGSMDVDQRQPAAVAAPAGSSKGQSGVFLTCEELLLPLLVASCDPYEAVARRGSDLLVKIINPDAARPAVDLESPQLVASLMKLMLGNQDPAAPPPAPTPAGPAPAVRIMTLLVRSVAAARTFPAAPLVMSACMFGPSSSPRLVRLGAEWAGWVFKHAESHQLRAMAGPVSARLMAAVGLAEMVEEEGIAEGDGGPQAMQVDGAPAASAARAAGASSSAAPSSLSGSAEARGYIFSALAQLTQRLPDMFKGDTVLASRLFAALSVEPAGSRTALQEALGGLAAAMTAGMQGTTAAAAGAPSVNGDLVAVGSGDESKQQEIEQLLVKNITSNQASVRLCAAQWATRLFPRMHMPSRYICLLAAGDSKPEVRDVGMSGLGLSRVHIPPGSTPTAYRTAVSQLGLPAPGIIIDYLVHRHKQLAMPADLSRPLPLPDPSCRALVDFIRAAATAAAAASEGLGASYSPQSHALLLENLACRGSSRDTAATALEGLVEMLGGTADWMRGTQEMQQHATQLQERFTSSRMSWLLHWLSHHHLPVRLAAARLTALAATAATPEAALALLQQQLLGMFPVLEGVAAAASGGSSKLEEQEGSMLAAGLLVARAASCGQPALTADTQQQVVTALKQQLQQHSVSGRGSSGSAAGGISSSSRLTLAGAAAMALGYIGLTGTLDIPGLIAPADINSSSSNSDSTAAANNSSSSTSSKDSSVLQLLLDLAGGKDNRAALRAVAAIGYISTGSSSKDVHLAAAKGIIGLSSAKGVSEELMMALGEAAAATAGDVTGFDPQLMLWSNLDSIADCVDAVLGPEADTPTEAAASRQPAGQPQHQQPGGGGDMEVDTAAAAASRSVDCGADIQQYLLQHLTGTMAVSSREEVRCSGCLLLVSLVQLCRGSSLLADHLPQLQATFTGLLGDSSELTQDLAARGVSLVYTRGGAALQQQLLGQLLGLLQGGQAAAAGPGSTAAGAAGVKVSADTKLFEEGQLGNTPGGAGLTTYRELCSLANDLGQPDLIYRFMDLARASSALSAKRGAAVGVARIARLAATASGAEQGGLSSLLGPERLAALLPKLYRLTHDPSPKVSDSMSAIWSALLEDPRAALDTHFHPIVKSLLVDVGARLWRVRQAACAALTDLLSGRRWSQLEQHMEQLWVMCLRAVDDVKESVRAAAASLLRALRGISLRIMDRQQTPPADVASCCRTVLPLLAGSIGLGSSVDVVRGVSADVICSGLKTAGSAQVLSVLPVVVPVLLEALSGMEDARLNYVEQHASAIGIDAERLAAARLAAARSSSLTEALDAASRALTAEGAGELAPGLTALIRRGVGLSTKAGTARLIRSLAARLGQDLKPAAPALLKPLITAVTSESSMQVKKAYAGAAAALVVRCVGDKRRDKFVSDAVASYGAVAGTISAWHPGDTAPATTAMSVDESCGSADEATRQAGGLLLRELLKDSSDTFNKYAAQILPTALLASHDECSSVCGVWSTVWAEGCPSAPAALRMFAPELAGLIASSIASSSWDRKKGAAKALIVVADAAGEQLSPYSPALAQLLLTEVSGGRLWEGKELMLQALGSLGANCTAVLAQQPGTAVLLNGLLAAAARKKKSYRSAALASLQKVLEALQGPAMAADGQDVWEVVSPTLLGALQQQLEAASKQPDRPASALENGLAATAGPGDNGNEEVKPLPLSETCSCLSAAWRLLPNELQRGAVAATVPLLTGLMTAPGLPWAQWLAVVSLVVMVLDTAGNGSPAADCIPLAAGLVHVLKHSTVSQLRLKCLHALLTLIKAVAEDTQATAEFLAAGVQPGHFGAAGSSPGPGGLHLLVSSCLAEVKSQDPASAHKSLAEEAEGVLAKCVKH